MKKSLAILALSSFVVAAAVNGRVDRFAINGRALINSRAASSGGSTPTLPSKTIFDTEANAPLFDTEANATTVTTD